MPYLLDYLETKLASFEDEPLNPVDSAALTQLCMVRGEDVLPPLEERKSFAGLRAILRNVTERDAPRAHPRHAARRAFPRHVHRT